MLNFPPVQEYVDSSFPPIRIDAGYFGANEWQCNVDILLLQDVFEDFPREVWRILMDNNRDVVFQAESSPHHQDFGIDTIFFRHGAETGIFLARCATNVNIFMIPRARTRFVNMARGTGKEISFHDQLLHFFEWLVKCFLCMADLFTDVAWQPMQDILVDMLVLAVLVHVPCMKCLPAWPVSVAEGAWRNFQGLAS